MAHVVLLLLILVHTFITLAAASSGIKPTTADPPAISPSNDRNVRAAEAPKSRKLGKHDVSESEEPSTESSSSHGENSGSTMEETVMYLEKHHHHSSVDKSVAGGGVIVGGLVTAFVVSIFCYIRATRRRSIVEPPTPSGGSSV